MPGVGGGPVAGLGRLVADRDREGRLASGARRVREGQGLDGLEVPDELDVIDERLDHALGRDDLAVDPLERALLAVGRAEDDPPGAAGAEVPLAEGEGRAAGAEPAGDVLGLRDRLPDERAGRVERPGQAELQVRRHRHGQGVRPRPRLLRRDLGEPVDRLDEALGGPVLLDDVIALLGRGEEQPHRNPGLAADLLEGGRHLVADRLDVPVAAVLEGDPLGLDDLGVRDPVLVVGPVGAVHAVPPDASRAEVHRGGRGGEPPRPPPSADVLRVRPELEHERPGRVEDARGDEFTVGGRRLRRCRRDGGRVTVRCGHSASPVLGVP